MWEAERIRGAAWTEKSDTAVDTEDIEKGLEPAECAEDARGEEEDFEKSVFVYGFSSSEFDDADGGDNNAPEDARSENGAKGIAAPEGSSREVERKEESEERKGGAKSAFFSENFDCIIYVIQCVSERENGKKEEPDEREGKFVVGAGGFGKMKQRIVRAKKGGGEGIEEGEAELSQF